MFSTDDIIEKIGAILQKGWQYLALVGLLLASTNRNDLHDDMGFNQEWFQEPLTSIF